MQVLEGAGGKGRRVRVSGRLLLEAGHEVEQLPSVYGKANIGNPREYQRRIDEIVEGERFGSLGEPHGEGMRGGDGRLGLGCQRESCEEDKGENGGQSGDRSSHDGTIVAVPLDIRQGFAIESQ